MEVRRIPSTGLTQSQSMQLDLERAISRFPQVAVVFAHGHA
jgi:cobalt-zinc-cadmium resistance protein CzcA